MSAGAPVQPAQRRRHDTGERGAARLTHHGWQEGTHAGKVSSCVWSKNSGRAFTCGGDGHIAEWDPETQAQARSDAHIHRRVLRALRSNWQADKRALSCVAIGPDVNVGEDVEPVETLLSAGSSIKLWNLSTREELRVCYDSWTIAFTQPAAENRRAREPNQCAVGVQRNHAAVGCVLQERGGPAQSVGFGGDQQEGLRAYLPNKMPTSPFVQIRKAAASFLLPAAVADVSVNQSSESVRRRLCCCPPDAVQWRVLGVGKDGLLYIFDHAAAAEPIETPLEPSAVISISTGP